MTENSYGAKKNSWRRIVSQTTRGSSAEQIRWDNLQEWSRSPIMARATTPQGEDNIGKKVYIHSRAVDVVASPEADGTK